MVVVGGVLDEDQHHLGVKHPLARTGHVDPPDVESRGQRVLAQRRAVVVDGQVLEVAQRVVELQELDLVDLVKAAVKQQRQDVQLEEGRVETKRGEHGGDHAAAVDRLGQLLGEDPGGDVSRRPDHARASSRVTLWSGATK
jgi:hypothetical protein